MHRYFLRIDTSNPHIKESVFYIKEKIDYYILQGWLVWLAVQRSREERIIMTRKIITL